MNAEQFVDTSILMYAHDASAGEKQQRVKALAVRATRDLIADYLSWQVMVNTGESILEALDLEDRYQISFWDALVVHAAQASGAEVLFGEDLSDGQTYGSVRVVNPLAPAR